MNIICWVIGLVMGLGIGYMVAVETQDAYVNKACKTAYKKGRIKERKEAFVENIKLHNRLEQLEGDNEYLRSKLNTRELMLDE